MKARVLLYSLSRREYRVSLPLRHQPGHGGYRGRLLAGRGAAGDGPIAALKYEGPASILFTSVCPFNLLLIVSFKLGVTFFPLIRHT